MTIHDLKTVQPHFDAVSSGAKKAEVRRDDRGRESRHTNSTEQWR